MSSIWQLNSSQRDDLRLLDSYNEPSVSQIVGPNLTDCDREADKENVFSPTES